MSHHTVLHKIVSIVAEVLQVPSGAVILPETVVLNASGLLEHDIRELVMRIEEEFDIDIPETDLENMHTIKDLVDYVTEATKESGKE